AWFDGTDDFIKGTNDPGYATTWSLVARVRRENTDERDTIFSQGPTNSATGDFMCHLGFSREGDGIMDARMLDVEDDNEWVYSAAAEAILDDGDWHDVAYVWTNGITKASMQFWVDGVLYPPSSAYSPAPPLNDSPHPITVGARADFVGLPLTAYPYCFDGDLDGIAFYWRVLSSQELVQCRENMPW
nr:hypothetical protein [Candidatus Thermoplasmatota archaeon]